MFLILAHMKKGAPEIFRMCEMKDTPWPNISLTFWTALLQPKGMLNTINVVLPEVYKVGFISLTHAHTLTDLCHVG